MPDLTKAEQKEIESGATPGPGSKTEDAVDKSAMALPPALDDDGVDLSMMTAEDIKVRIIARERDMKFRIESLKHEALAVGEDIVIDGRPLFDIVRASPWLTMAAVGGTGALVGVALGVWSRARHAVEPDHGVNAFRARVAMMIDDAAADVARGTSAEDAIRRSTHHFPVYVTSDRSTAGTAGAQARSSVRQAVDLAVKSAFGFAIKAGTDQLTQKLTGKKDTLDAVAEAP